MALIPSTTCAPWALFNSCPSVACAIAAVRLSLHQEMERLSRFSSSVATARLVSSPSGAYDPSLAGALEGLKVSPKWGTSPALERGAWP